ncbi:citrate lyase acyl carrier protein [Lactococcus paracarnosus]|uniref:Citrate lyase acyl carrier protein n=1 Tax=Pseudolactococcus paracarnosus TaxID=2749962 RepID=A0A7L4WG54_9LACT|nr:citrate lyase acyl carrier protein [Lactococcus paracarnosus]SPC35521.1 citrate lyase, acyl carrier (gamma) subunit [Lactococcus piscium]MCJ1977110.1 citrate lyase acyl carrier protein [Lactococcus paracarnosus]MCJ1983146.1 citrate lyase acyl carrier protein [Lactococcus paracarnosus]MCJ1993934.1 citrate lyase acyl carrier protein [Lactococcus paracarnosus]MCJ1997242.1 citrate lyase acyl carrier protein [Lactococcus paracarnosus]
MEVKKTALAGTLESSDVQVMISPNESGITIDLVSDVKKQFGEAIVARVKQVLSAYDITDAMVKIVDKGALDSVIKARMIAAVQRALDIVEEPKWEVL